jgi:hypothetical protein
MKRKRRINLVGKEIKTQRRKVNCIEIKGKYKDQIARDEQEDE